MTFTLLNGTLRPMTNSRKDYVQNNGVYRMIDDLEILYPERSVIEVGAKSPFNYFSHHFAANVHWPNYFPQFSFREISGTFRSISIGILR
ncbi:hypothetical protein Smp_164710 [Schistosoma mansoni]|uniref:Radical SAM protein n=1 Tax=Schistosoma mansoni TaxID=6183 RepID=G4LV35_SCHMA|nr:hypothetical protein Smp_164710 [Schistosoma mansoni]|eukprot:XP_018645137.1 hypothetical protein Smp_164710 [Schistosoma mansoni]